MRPDSTHIKQIKVVSNTHWDREFRFSFEKTRRWLLIMLDSAIELLQTDPRFPAFTLDGHAIMIEDYLEIKPKQRLVVDHLIREGRLIIGPYYTLAEQFSISHEPIIRNLLWGRKTVEAHGGKVGTVAYTPSSWGQTGQLPQILNDFGLTKLMFYRGISHHESDEDAAGHITSNLAPGDLAQDGIQLIVFNTLPFERDALVHLALELPRAQELQTVVLEHPNDPQVSCQVIAAEAKNTLVDSRWDTPCYMETRLVKLYAHFRKLPASGYRVYRLQAARQPYATLNTLVTGPNTLENEYLRVKVNPDGTVSLFHKPTQKSYCNLNYLSDWGQSGDAWQHQSPPFDREYNTLGIKAQLEITESGPLVSTITAEYTMMLPRQWRTVILTWFNAQ